VYRASCMPARLAACMTDTPSYGQRKLKLTTTQVGSHTTFSSLVCTGHSQSIAGQLVSLCCCDLAWRRKIHCRTPCCHPHGRHRHVNCIMAAHSCAHETANLPAMFNSSFCRLHKTHLSPGGAAFLGRNQLHRVVLFCRRQLRLERRHLRVERRQLDVLGGRGVQGIAEGAGTLLGLVVHGLDAVDKGIFAYLQTVDSTQL